MSSREPLWYCHECNAEMRPLMVPDPHCASCNGTFVEMMENPADDPREFSHGHAGAGGLPDDSPLAGNDILSGLLSLLAGGPAMPPPRPGSTQSPRGASASPAGLRSGGNGFRMEFSSSSNGPSGARTFVLGGPNTLGGAPRTADAAPPVPGTNAGAGQAPGDIQGALMMQYLMAMMGQGPFGRGGGEDPFGMLGEHPGGGQWGDYVFSQDALDQIISQMMENSNAHRPVAASEEVIDKLPREVLEDGSPLLEKDCAICKDQFKIGTEDPEEQIVVTLPCKHPFHQPCILPWLKSSGTCPVCRFALVPQPGHGDEHASDGSPPGGSGPSPSPDEHAREGSDRGILDSIISYIRTGQSGGGSSGGSGAAGAGAGTGSGSGGANASGGSGQERRNVPGGWSEQVD